MQTDEELAALAAGDEDAFRALVERYEKKVYNVALRHSGHPDDAFDITQDIFLKVWRGLESFRGESSFSTWLYRLTHNACMDYARREKKRRVLSLDSDEGLPARDLPDERFDPVRRQENKQLREDIETALGRISPDYRAILLLREISGLSYAEIAAVLSLEEGTVKSRLCRARMRLREVLLAMWNEPGKKTSKEPKKKVRGDQ